MESLVYNLQTATLDLKVCYFVIILFHALVSYSYVRL